MSYRNDILRICLLSLVLALLTYLAYGQVKARNEFRLDDEFFFDFDFNLNSADVTLRDFLIEYDFKSKEGNILFELVHSGKSTLQHATIKLPVGVEMKHIVLVDKSGNVLELNKHFTLSNTSKTLVLKFIDYFDTEIAFNVSMVGNESFTPNGKFGFIVKSDQVFGNDGDPRGTMYLRLGDYECVDPCVDSDWYGETKAYNASKNILVRIPKNDSGVRLLTNNQQYVYLNTINIQDRRDKEWWSDVYIALLVALIVFIFDSFRDFSLKKDKSNNKSFSIKSGFSFGIFVLLLIGVLIFLLGLHDSYGSMADWLFGFGLVMIALAELYLHNYHRQKDENRGVASYIAKEVLPLLSTKVESNLMFCENKFFVVINDRSSFMQLQILFLEEHVKKYLDRLSSKLHQKVKEYNLEINEFNKLFMAELNKIKDNLIELSEDFLEKNKLRAVDKYALAFFYIGNALGGIKFKRHVESTHWPNLNTNIIDEELNNEKVLKLVHKTFDNLMSRANELNIKGKKLLEELKESKEKLIYEYSLNPYSK